MHAFLIGLICGAGSLRPVAVKGISDTVAVLALPDRSCAARRSGKVSCWSRGTVPRPVRDLRLVTGDRRPPLIFDDPFVTLDDARAGRALTLLKSIAADFQVIYMTTSSRYDEAADAVVVLDGPTSVDDGVTEGTADAIASAPSPTAVPAPSGRT